MIYWTQKNPVRWFLFVCFYFSFNYRDSRFPVLVRSAAQLWWRRSPCWLQHWLIQGTGESDRSSEVFVPAFATNLRRHLRVVHPNPARASRFRYLYFSLWLKNKMFSRPRHLFRNLPEARRLSCMRKICMCSVVWPEAFRRAMTLTLCARNNYGAL